MTCLVYWLDADLLLQELKKQLAMKEHQQLQQQQQQQAAQIAANAGMQPWPQQQHLQQQQQVPYSGPGRLSMGWSMQQQQQQPHQQQRPPLQPIACGQSRHMGQPVAAGTWQQQLQQFVGQKRSWEQISASGPPPQQQQQQAAAAAAAISWPLLTLQPVSGTNSGTNCISQPRIGSAGVSAVEYSSTQAPGAFPGYATGGMAATAAAGPRRRCLPGCFSTLQEFELSGSRSFYLDVPGTLALVAETPSQGCSRLRKVGICMLPSILCPACAQTQQSMKAWFCIRGGKQQ